MVNVVKLVSDNMKNKFEYKIVDYVNFEHHNYNDVESFLNKLGQNGFELLEVIDMGDNNSNKDGKSSRYRYIFKRWISN